MTSERFNELVNGPLHDPIAPLAIGRLILALHAVVRATGEAGAAALERHCADRQTRDEAQDGRPRGVGEGQHGME